ncbi:TetR/AcrR family transcriptional regulator [Nocardia inohanensis]|uniref:TetR/AcrR family transcriptional regulator n=1 Tax=Nocardia inohanensis TaxID=209246 RepID=UPI000834BAEB|nr:TetR/AcrR family transcriptional regulator [Nocardia inohanensis]
MTEAPAKTPRERYRAQMQAEIKQVAWDQIATAGASALSLNAIAKQVGMSGPALYRYFPSRDDLITDLIRDAYRSLSDTLHQARTAGADLTELAHSLRDWALTNPHRYFLIYGTPIPGYHAPADTTEISDRIMTLLIEVLAETPSPTPPSRRALAFWTRLHGVLSLELAGHFTGMRIDPAGLYTEELDSLLQ